MPAAFTDTTGRAHWEILLRARAIENQCYLLAVGQGGRHENGRMTHGNSMIVDPWGEILDRKMKGPGVVIADLDHARIAEIRESLPALAHRNSNEIELSMNPNSALAQAESLLLTPFSLTEGDLSRTFGQILTHQVDYADLYFQYSRSEAWSLDEGIVKSGSFNIDQGVGVRAISGEKTAFAYSDDISSRALTDAATAVRAIAARGQSMAFCRRSSMVLPAPSIAVCAA
jgi:hypothetical protein